MKKGTAERYMDYLNRVNNLPLSATLRDARKLVNEVGVSCAITKGMEEMEYFAIVEGSKGLRYKSMIGRDAFTLNEAIALAKHINQKMRASKKDKEKEAVKALIDQTLIPSEELTLKDIPQVVEAISDDAYFLSVIKEARRRGFDIELTITKKYK